MDWLWVDGTPMTSDRWGSGALAVGMWLNGAALVDTDDHGNILTDDTCLVLFNAWWKPGTFTLPGASRGATWQPVLDTNQSTGAPANPVPTLAAGSGYTLGPRSLLVLRRTS